MIKLVLFDLDGVLVDTKQMHFDALNQALEKNDYLPITLNEHLLRFDGLTTDQKLDILEIPDNEKRKIHTRKQAYTYMTLNTIKPNHDII